MSQQSVGVILDNDGLAILAGVLNQSEDKLIKNLALDIVEEVIARGNKEQLNQVLMEAGIISPLVKNLHERG